MHNLALISLLVTFSPVLVLCARQAPTPAASSITCYTGAPAAANGAPVVVAMAFKKADGFDICVRYQFPCMAGDSSCSAAEIKANTLKWQYTATSNANCAYLKQVGKNTLCCSTDGCNKPDPKLDPATKIQPYPAAGAAPPNNPTAPTTQPAVKPATPAATPTSPATVQRSASPSKCYQVGMPGAANLRTAVLQPVPAMETPELLVCVRYQFPCSKGDTGCTNDQQKAGTWLWNYTAVAAKTCSTLIGMMQEPYSPYKSVFCCNTDACNKPDPKQDTSTRVQP